MAEVSSSGITVLCREWNSGTLRRRLGDGCPWRPTTIKNSIFESRRTGFVKETLHRPLALGPRLNLRLPPRLSGKTKIVFATGVEL